jgi:hypothetical protein
MVVVVGVVLVLAVAGVRRWRAWRRMMELARAGAQARAEPVSPDVLTARQRELLVQM